MNWEAKRLNWAEVGSLFRVKSSSLRTNVPPDVVRTKFSAGTHVNNQSTVYIVSS